MLKKYKISVLILLIFIFFFVTVVPTSAHRNRHNAWSHGGYIRPVYNYSDNNEYSAINEEAREYLKTNPGPVYYKGYSYNSKTNSFRSYGPLYTYPKHP